MGDGGVQVCPFEREHFGEDFPDSGFPQTEYLWDYLGHLDSQSFVREVHYVDRHHLDDFTRYYARSFRVPKAHCRRLHYFSLPPEQLEQLIDRFYAADAKDDEARRSVEAKLEETYLGYVVRRPLRRAHIGRTILKTYPIDGGRRQYTAVRRYAVHIGAITLEIEGLAYQQQDVGAAVCASTALWSALQKVADLAGYRTPTPSQVTEASGSPYAASHGLTESQMAAALSHLGYGADKFSPGDSNVAFKAKVAACLRSHLPVILMLDDHIEGHAVTVTGYSDPDQAVPVPPYEGKDSGLPMSSGSLRVIYVHDDNLGSHAHYELLDEMPDDLEEQAYKHGDLDDPLWLLLGRSEGPWPRWWKKSCLRVCGALVPKPSKVRMPVDDLLQLAWSLRHTMELIFDDIELSYEVAFDSGVEYRRAMLGFHVEPEQRRSFDFRVELPRHLAVVSAYYDRAHMCDFLLDATAVDLAPDEESLLGVVAPGVPKWSQAYKNLVVVCEEVGVPFISGPVQSE